MIPKLIDLLREIRIVNTYGWYKLKNLQKGDKFTSSFKFKDQQRDYEGTIEEIYLYSNKSAYLQLDLSKEGRFVLHTSIMVPPLEEYDYYQSDPDPLDHNLYIGTLFMDNLKIIKNDS